MSESSSGRPSYDGTHAKSTRTNTIITALATVLAAVILAAGGIIANKNKANNELEVSVRELHAQLDVKSGEINDLNRMISQLRAQLKNPTPDPEPPQATSALEEDGFSFTRPECARSGTTVTCQMSISNNGATRHLRLHGRPDLRDLNSRALDDQGNQQQADRAVLAGVSDTDPGIEVAGGTRVKASIRFRDIPPTISSFSVLHIGFEIHITDHGLDFPKVKIAA